MKSLPVLNPCDHSIVRTFCGIFSDMDHLEAEMHIDQKTTLQPAINVSETDTAYLFEMAPAVVSGKPPCLNTLLKSIISL